VEQLKVDIQNTRDELRQDVEEIRRAFTEREEDMLAQQDDELADLGNSPSCQLVHRVLEAAADEHVISEEWGFRVHVIDESIRVFARLLPMEEDEVEVHIEGADGSRYGFVLWQPDRTPADFMLEVSNVLRAASVHPGANRFDPTFLFSGLRKDLTIGKEKKRKFTLLESLDFAQQYVAPQWMIYDWGIASWDMGATPYWIGTDSLTQSDWIHHMSEKTWVNQDSFREAFRTALALKESGRSQLRGSSELTPAQRAEGCRTSGLSARPLNDRPPERTISRAATRANSISALVACQYGARAAVNHGQWRSLGQLTPGQGCTRRVPKTCATWEDRRSWP
jgi:hypothetical protein